MSSGSSEILKETGLDAGYLNLEITESVARDDPDHAIAAITRLTEMGVSMVIDHFGAGQASLDYLKKLSIRKFKIDPSLIKDIADPENRIDIKAVTGLARDLTVRVIAEGVETQEQQNLLESLGCQEMQGYLFSEPLRPEEFTELIEKN